MYNYTVERPELFTEAGQRMFIKIRDHVNCLLKEAGAVRMQEAINADCSGSSWQMLACVDRLVELEEIKELTDPTKVAGQYRVFVRRY